MRTNQKNPLRALLLVTLALSLSTIHQAQAAAWTTNSPMITARYGHTVTLLPNGKLLAAGGYGTNLIPSLNYLSGAELYDPASGTWRATGNQGCSRAFHTATLLPSGKVLIVGGYGSSGGLRSSAELYDPANGTWTTTGALATAREYHTATLLPNGIVLVVGGENGPLTPTWSSNSVASAELYDPATGKWAATGGLATARYGHTATLLPNGKVLVAGGSVGFGGLSSSELYDPASGTWTVTGRLNTVRNQLTATLLPDGRVLAAGGGSTLSFPLSGPNAELYDPATETWAATGGFKTDRFGHTATLLPNGKVLAIGGYNGGALSSVEIYDPSTGTWSAAGTLAKARQLHTTTVLPNGKVLVAGGQGSLVFNDAVSKVELYDLASGVWRATGGLTIARYRHTTTLLPDGRVLAAGGTSGNPSSTELYDPVTGTWITTGPLNTARNDPTATLLPNGSVLLAGGYGASILSSAELYSPTSRVWTTTGALTAGRWYQTATLLSNGKVLLAGGSGAASHYLASAELYDPITGKWTVTGALNTARYKHTATLLPSGMVLVAGGYGDSGGVLASAELYDPAIGAWAATGTLVAGRAWHTATLLPNGKVLVAAGTTSSPRAEVYDPITGTWTAAGNMTVSRTWHTATLLPNGKVLVAGGNSPTAELYDPATGTWAATSSLITGRYFHTATLLPNGKVLVAGGSGSGLLSSAEVYDMSLGFSPAWQPQLASTMPPLSLGSSLALTGSGFRGVSEGSGGNSQDSAADYPLMQLRAVDSERTVFLIATNWQTNSFTSTPVWGFPPGYALATVFVNGIPSTGAVVNISVPVPTATTLTGAKRLTNGAFQFSFTNNVGALFGVLATTNPALPSTNWTLLSGVTEVCPGQFQFTDLQATNTPRRFYRLRSP
jgi:WD40 repeat protein